MALCKKRPPTGMASINSRGVQSFVTLQRPFPVMRSFLPKSLFGSSSTVLRPRPAARAAQNVPAAPPPIITASAVNIFKHLVVAPNLLELLERVAQRAAAARADGDDDGVHKAHWRN